jgi:hypothetical protein
MQQYCRLIIPGTIVALAILASPFASAQSSGNFTATVDNTVCSINTTNGVLIPPPDTMNNFLFTGPGGGSMKAVIKLPNSSPGLLVTPSLDTGLYTNTGNSGVSQTAAVVVVVTDTPTSGSPVTLTPNQTCVVTDDTTNAQACGVVYDERFQQLTARFGMFSFDKLVLSTMSAHSFNFTEGNVPGGTHTIQVNWYFGCDDGTGTLRTSSCATMLGPNTAAACAGPGTLTVQQVQNFQHDSQIQTTGQ